MFLSQMAHISLPHRPHSPTWTPPASPNVIYRKPKRKRFAEKEKEKEKEKQELKKAPKMPSIVTLERRYRQELLAKGYNTLSSYLADLELYSKTGESEVKDSTFFPSVTKVVKKKLKLAIVAKPPEPKSFHQELFAQFLRDVYIHLAFVL